MIAVCTNECCDRHGKEVEQLKAVYKFIDGKLRLSNVCDACKEYLEEVKSEEVPLSLKSIHIGKYSSGSKEQKQDMLKKRARDHFKKNIKPFKDHQNNELAKEFKQIAKGG